MISEVLERQAPPLLTAAAAPLLLPRRPVRRILLPTDFSDLSLEPLGLAAELAKATGAEVHFLFVEALGGDTMNSHDFPSADDVETAWWRAGPNSMHKVAKAGAFKPPVVSAVERSVEIAPAISRYAFEHKIDLIIMATAARKGMSRFFLGSVAEEVVRKAPCSVLIAQDESLNRNVSEPPKVLAAVDFSDTSMEAARLAAELSETLGAELTVLHAVGQPMAPTFYGAEYMVSPAIMDDVIERCEKELTEFAQNELHSAEVEVRLGATLRTILDATQELEADLVVVGSHGLTGLPRFLLGSVAEKLVRLSAVPVLVVRPAAEAKEFQA